VVPVRLEDEESVEIDPEGPVTPADNGDLLGKAIDSGVQLSRLYGEVNVARRRLESAVSTANALNRFARRMLAAPAPDSIWHEMHQGAREQVPCHRSSLLYRIRDDGPLESAEVEGHETDPFLASMGEQSDRFLAHLGEAAHLSDRDAPELMSRIRTADPDVLSTLIVPVQVRSRVEGAVILYRGGGYPQFQMKDTRFLSSVANLAALGLDRALRERDIVELNRELEGRVRDRTARLTDALRTIRRLNAGLTERVQQRTAELDKANATLERTQDFLMQAEKMSSLARLASGIAHEINNPMAYVQGNLKALGEYSDDLQRAFSRIEEAASGDDAECAISAIRMALADPGLSTVREDLTSLVKETSEGATRVVQVAEGIRNLAHLSTTEMRPVDIHEQIESTLRILGSRLKDGVEVVTEFGEVPRVQGFPVLLSQMILNICVNAIDAMEGRGRLTIRTGVAPDAALVEISDDGPGIPEDILPQVFEPFFTTKDVGKGTGLGLYTVYQIVERHGGEVAIDSGPDRGTKFTFRLPAAMEPAVEMAGLDSEGAE
jgi:two-component system NtrC family sensor kinase